MHYPSYPESRASTACVDIDAFVSEESGSSNVAGHRWSRGIGGVSVLGTPVLMNNPICRLTGVVS